MNNNWENIERKKVFALVIACKDGNLEAVRSLLQAGANVNGWIYRLLVCLYPDYGLLHLAAKKAHAEIVKVLVDNGAKVNTTDSNGFTPLFTVLDGWHGFNPEQAIETAKTLVDAGANVNFTAPIGTKRPKYRHDPHTRGGICIEEEFKFWGETPLRRAIRLGLPAAVKLFLASGASISAKGEDGRTPLSWAALFSTEILKIILEAGGDVNESDILGRKPLHNAARVCNVENVRLLLEAGAVADAPDSVGVTPLQFVFHSQAGVVGGDHKNNKIAIVKLLLDSGSDINKISLRHVEINFRYRAEKKQCCELHDYSCAHVPLRCAFSSLFHDPDPTLMKMLIEEYNADIHIKDSEGGTMLCWAAATGTTGFNAVKFLIESNGNVNERGKWNETPLHHAASWSDVGGIQILLEAGADPNAKDSRKQTPLHYFFCCDCQCTTKTGQCDTRALEMLLRADADPNSVDQSGRTPLHHVSAHSDEQAYRLAQMLLEAGADPNIAGSLCGNTPIKKATDPMMVTTLLEYGAGNVRCSCLTSGCDSTALRCHYRAVSDTIHVFEPYRLSPGFMEQTFRNMQNVIVSMEEYYIKMSVSGLRTITNFTDICPPSWWSKRRFFRYKCNKEFARMKLEKVGTTDVTYHQVFTADARAKNPELLEILTREGCVAAFPIFGGLIYVRYHTVVRPSIIFDLSKRLFTLTEDLPLLPDLCVEKILRYLRVKDLEVVNRVCEGEAAFTGTPQHNLARTGNVGKVTFTVKSCVKSLSKLIIARTGGRAHGNSAEH